MNLKRLEINKRESYQSNPGQLEGSIKFESDTGEITLRLTPDHIQQIINVCADSLVVVSKAVAEELTSNVIEASVKPLLEDQS